MTTKKTQEESEQPAKVYQLDAVDTKVTELAAEMRTAFLQVNQSLTTLVDKSSTQVTPQQLADNIAVVKKAQEESDKALEKRIHLEFDPLKEQNKWLIRAIAGQAVIIVFQVIVVLYITRG